MYSFARCSENLNSKKVLRRAKLFALFFKPKRCKTAKGNWTMQIALEVFQLDWRSYFAPHVKSTDQNFEKAMLEYFLKGDLALWIVVRAGRSYLAGLVCIESDFSLGRWSGGGSFSPFEPAPKKLLHPAVAAAKAVVDKLKELVSNHKSECNARAAE